MPHPKRKTAVSPAALGPKPAIPARPRIASAGAVWADSTPVAPGPLEPPAAISGAPAPTDAAAAPAAVVAPVAATAVAATQDPATEERLKALEERIRQLTDELKAVKEGQKPEALGKVVDEKLKKQKPLAGWNNGFFWESADGENKLRLRGYLQSDFRGATTPTGRTNTDTFFLRRVRPIFEGTVQKYVDFRIMPDFGGGATVLQDAYLQLNYFPSAQIRVGKFKEPVSLERLQSGSELLFVERSIANNLAPVRDVGIQIGGPVLGGKAEYQIGLFNGVQDGGSADGDAGNDKDLAARVFLTPFKKNAKSVLNGLGIGVSMTNGSHDEVSAGVLNYRTASRASFYRPTAGTTGDGRVLRLAPQLYYFYGPFGLMGEYITSKQELVNGAAKGDIKNRAYFVQASYVLTGEKNSYRGVTPRKPFDPKKGTWGAFELAARYSRVDIDDDAFTLGFADPATSVGAASAFTIGLNWYLNRALKLQLNYERTTFDRKIPFGANTTDHEDVFLARFQVSF
jgi:phosphate-selective porin OprO and OprP